MHARTFSHPLHPIALQIRLQGDTQKEREREMCGIILFEPRGRQGGVYLGHILERRIIKSGALEISYMKTLMHMHGANTIPHTEMEIHTDSQLTQLAIPFHILPVMLLWDKSTPRCTFDFQLTWFTGVSTLMHRNLLARRLQGAPTLFFPLMSHLVSEHR